MRRLFLVAAGVVAAAGCTLLDRSTLEVEPAGILYAGAGGPVDADGFPVFVLEVKSAGGEVDLAIDGDELGRPFPANRRIELRALALRPGPHTLTVRERDTASPSSLERKLAYYPEVPRLVETTPPPEAGASAERFTVGLRFDVPVMPGLVPGHAWLEANGARLPAAARAGPGRNTISLDLPAPVPTLGAVTARVDAGAFAMPAGPAWQQTWAAELLRARIVVPLGGPFTGPVQLRVETLAGSVFPPWTELLVDGAPVARFVGAPEAADGAWTTSWDSTTVHDGEHTLDLGVPDGHHFTLVEAAPTLQTDNYAPRILSCARPDRQRWCWTLQVEADGRLEEATLGVAGQTVSLSSGFPPSRLYCAYAPPLVDPAQMSGEATIEVLTSDSRSRVLRSTCKTPFPTWEAPHGDPVPGPAGVSEVSLANAGVCSLPMGATDCPAGFESAFVVIAGREVRLWRLSASGTLSATPAALNQVPGAIPSGLVFGFWLEQLRGGPRGLYTRAGGPSNLDPLKDAGPIAYVPESLMDSISWDRLAWVEEVAPGERAAVLGIALPALAPGSTVGEIAVHAPIYDPFAFGPGNNYLAFTETPPGGVSGLRVGTRAWGGLAPIPELERLSPAVPVAEPAVYVKRGLVAVAWREGGLVLARSLTAAGATEVVVVNADPAHAARSPRLDGNAPEGTLYWIERNGAVDEIRMRRWNGSSWVLQPTPVNDPPGGTVASLSVAGGRLAWVDAGGAVHFRRANFR